MAKFILIRGKPIEAHGYRFEAGVPVEVTEEQIVRKLRGNKSSFKEAD